MDKSWGLSVSQGRRPRSCAVSMIYECLIFIQVLIHDKRSVSVQESWVLRVGVGRRQRRPARHEVEVST